MTIRVDCHVNRAVSLGDRASTGARLFRYSNGRINSSHVKPKAVYEAPWQSGRLPSSAKPGRKETKTIWRAGLLALRKIWNRIARR